jgi:hypothetical protein
MITMAMQAVTATREPTERSIPAVIMTKVMPDAIMALMETCLATFMRLFNVKNLGVVNDTPTKRTMSMATAPYWERSLVTF